MSTQYPNATDQFPIHSDNTGEKIPASVVNNLQDAIVALEQKLGPSGLTSFPQAGPADSLTIVNHQLYISNGTAWVAISASSNALSWFIR